MGFTKKSNQPLDEFVNRLLDISAQDQKHGCFKSSSGNGVQISIETTGYIVLPVYIYSVPRICLCGGFPTEIA